MLTSFIPRYCFSSSATGTRALDGGIYGKPLTDRGLATKLKPYGIKSRDVRIGEVVLKGLHD